MKILLSICEVFAKEYDVLLNSCFHIYDKKGQYKMINAAVKYKEMFGKDLINSPPTFLPFLKGKL